MVFQGRIKYFIFFNRFRHHATDVIHVRVCLNRPGGTITGKNRLKLIRAVRKYTFYEPAVNARKAKGLFVPGLV